MKKLPDIYKNQINKRMNNSQEYIVVNKKEQFNKEEINKKINDIFKSDNYIYKIKVIIETEDGILEKYIIGKNNNYLITMDNELIDIEKIKDIKIKSN